MPSTFNKHILFRKAVNAPFFECIYTHDTLESGITNIVYSKKINNGMIAASIILLDLYCLGVKDAFVMIETLLEYQKFKAKTPGEWLSIHPVCAKKMIEGSVEYAKNIGFSPHDDFKLAFQLFSTIDSSLCNESYEYGLKGKPFYISGPNESPAQIQTIFRKLEQKCGKDGFLFVTALSE